MIKNCLDVVVSFLLLFAWWGSQSFVWYWSQPLTTDISSSFGDKHNAIQFPLVTLCQGDFPTHNSVLKNCSDSYHFMPAIYDCLKNDKKFRIDDFMESLQIHRRNVVESSKMWTGLSYILLCHLMFFHFSCSIFFFCIFVTHT